MGPLVTPVFDKLECFLWAKCELSSVLCWAAISAASWILPLTALSPLWWENSTFLGLWSKPWKITFSLIHTILKGVWTPNYIFHIFLKSKRSLMIYVWECAINTQHSCVITHISVFKSIPVDKTTITVHLKVELTRHTNCVICAGEPLACCICNMCSRFFTARPISVTDICAVQLPLSSFSSFSPLSIFLG